MACPSHFDGCVPNSEAAHEDYFKAHHPDNSTISPASQEAGSDNFDPHDMLHAVETGWRASNERRGREGGRADISWLLSPSGSDASSHAAIVEDANIGSRLLSSRLIGASESFQYTHISHSRMRYQIALSDINSGKTKWRCMSIPRYRENRDAMRCCCKDWAMVIVVADLNRHVGF